MSKVNFRKVSSSYWGGNGVGNVPASWGVFIDGDKKYTIKGKADYAGRGYSIVDNDGKLAKDLSQFFFSQLRHAKTFFKNNF